MIDEHRRKTIRLQNYDYGMNGAYHITLCTKNRVRVLSHIVTVGEGLCALPTVVLTDIGKEVEKSIWFIHDKWPHIHIERYVIMPDHIHMLIVMDNEGGHGGPPLPEVMRGFKSYTTHRYGRPLWQRSYNDHIIRGRQDYDETWQYIENNPIRWVNKEY